MVGQWHRVSWRRPTLRQRLEGWWRQLVPQPEAAHVELRHAYMPQRVRWRGMQQSIRAVERVWERPAGRPRRYFQVRCQNGQQITVFQDLRIGAWYICP